MLDNLIDSMTGPASWPFWIGAGLGALLYGLDRLTTRLSSKREDKIMRRRLSALKDYDPHPQYWRLEDTYTVAKPRNHDDLGTTPR
jgi:hypothetical protein